MSGSKVIRIVTREEIIQTYQRRLNRLDIATEQWLKQCAQFGGDIDHDLSIITARRQQLQGLLDSDQFIDLQKAVPLALASLAVNIADRREQAIIQKTDQLRHNRQLKENATILLSQLRAKKITPSRELLSQIEALTKGQNSATGDATLQQGFLLLQQPPSTAPDQVISARQQALLDKMATQPDNESFATWKANNKPRYLTPSVQKLDRYLSEISLIEPEAYQRFSARLQQVDSETHQAQRHLLLDSLNMDLATAIRQRDQRQTLIARLQQLIAEIQRQQVALPAALQEKINHFSEAELAEIEQLIPLWEAQLAQQQAEQAANYRHQVMLKGLAKLGYEVREGMATRWQQEGKLVVNNPAVPGYGVEVGSQENIERLQIRPVRLTQVEDKQRDRDVETLLCSDVDKLNQWMEKQGASLQLERSFPVGQVAVKYIATDPQSVPSSTLQHKHR